MQPRIKPGPGNAQHPTHRHDTPYSAVLIDKAVLQSGFLAKYCAAFSECPILPQCASAGP